MWNRPSERIVLELYLTFASDMFLGPANKNFKFEPKHKSNSYEIEAEG